MPLDPVRVGIAVSTGLSVVCATCTKYWEGRDRGLPDPQCTSIEACGSPIAGDDFHEYQGPIQAFERWCFACGSISTHGIRVHGRPRLIGVCDDHLHWMAQLEAVDGAPLAQLQREIKSSTGKLIAPEDLLKNRKKSLGESIYEVEKFYADKEGREL